MGCERGGGVGIRRITHTRAPLCRRHWMHYCCKHERRWKGKRIFPHVKRVAGPHSTAQHSPMSQAVFAVHVCACVCVRVQTCHGASSSTKEINVCLSNHASTLFPLSPFEFGPVGESQWRWWMLMGSGPANSAARHHDQQPLRLKQVAFGFSGVNRLLWLPVGISTIVVPLYKCGHFINSLEAVDLFIIIYLCFRLRSNMRRAKEELFTLCQVVKTSRYYVTVCFMKKSSVFHPSILLIMCRVRTATFY